MGVRERQMKMEDEWEGEAPSEPFVCSQEERLGRRLARLALPVRSHVHQ
jgi:hypothetical protein